MAVKEHGRGADQVSLRLPPGLRERIKEAADRNGRSMNAEIIALLEERYPEAISMGEYIQEWIVPIMAARTPEEVKRLVGAANRAGASANVPYRVRMSERPDGRMAPEIVSADDGNTLLYIG